MMSHSTWSSATGSVAKQQGVVLPGPLGRLVAERAALVDAPDAVHDLEDALLADDRVADDLGDELVAGVGVGRAVRPGDVVDQAVAHVLQGPGDARPSRGP